MGPLARARIPMQLDIWLRRPHYSRYRPRLGTQNCSISPRQFYRLIQKETVVAEKLDGPHAYVGSSPTSQDRRLLRCSPFVPNVITSRANSLAQAVSATFHHHRRTAIEAEPIGLTQTYCDDPSRALSNGVPSMRRSQFREEAGDLTSSCR